VAVVAVELWSIAAVAAAAAAGSPEAVALEASGSAVGLFWPLVAAGVAVGVVFAATVALGVVFAAEVVSGLVLVLEVAPVVPSVCVAVCLVPFVGLADVADLAVPPVELGLK
jgi:hypothetical protein